MSFLKQPVDFVGNTAQQTTGALGNGLQTAGNGVSNTASSLNPTGNKPQATNGESTDKSSTPAPEPSSALASEPEPKSGGADGFLSGIGSGVSGAVSTGVGSIQDVTSAGFDIGKKVAKTGLDVTGNVALGTADLAGTAVGGIVQTAAETSGKVFEPVASGLKAIEGLEGLGEGLEYVNGLPVKAVSEVGGWTIKAMNMSGKTPTFFDPDGDGVVIMPDTIRGLVVLGLDEKNAKYAAYALHSIFSYPTSDSWVPSTDLNLPIHIDKMSNTRWGKNWGTYERIDWCQDIDFNQFFVENEKASRTEQWQETFKKGRQYFGVLLLIFEWGTTWPFLLPQGMPVEQIPFKDDIGKVVRTLVLPTIFSNYQKAREADQKKPEAPPSESAPTESKDA